MQEYESYFKRHVNPKSWLRADIRRLTVELPNINTITDDSGDIDDYPLKGTDLPKRFKLVKKRNDLDRYANVADRITSIKLKNGAHITGDSVFTNCTELTIDHQIYFGVLDLKYFPALTKLDCQAMSSYVDVKGDSFRLTELWAGHNPTPDVLTNATMLRYIPDVGSDRVTSISAVVSHCNLGGKWPNLSSLSLRLYNPINLAPLSELLHLQKLTLGRYGAVFLNPFVTLPPLPNLRQLTVMFHHRHSVYLPSWLSSMKKLNRLTVDAPIGNWAFILHKLDFIPDLYLNPDTRDLLLPFICDTWCPSIRSYYSCSN